MTAPATVTTYLWFERDAEAAARFYCTLLPGARIVEIFAQQGDPEGRAFVVMFDLGGQRYAAMNGGPSYRLTPAVSIALTVETQAEIDRLWAAFLDNGGSESRCGWLTDRWGLSWQIVPRRLLDLLKGDRAAQVIQAMMGMVKLDIAALEAAASG